MYAVWAKYSQDIYLYYNGESYASEYIEGEDFSFGKYGEICTSSVIEKTLDNGNFSIGMDFIAITLREGVGDKYYLVDNEGNRLTDNEGNYLVEEQEEFLYAASTISDSVELLSSDKYILTDSNGLHLITKESE